VRVYERVRVSVCFFFCHMHGVCLCVRAVCACVVSCVV